jgi:hypothetical protein
MVPTAMIMNDAELVCLLSHLGLPADFPKTKPVRSRLAEAICGLPGEECQLGLKLCDKPPGMPLVDLKKFGGCSVFERPTYPAYDLCQRGITAFLDPICFPKMRLSFLKSTYENIFRFLDRHVLLLRIRDCATA